jgi:hypothetical protein
MRRASAVLLTATLLLCVGCGRRSYDLRLEHTLDDLRYRQRLDQFLIPAPTDPKFKDFPMYIRPPKGMTLSSQFVMLNDADLPPGQFDMSVSFTSRSGNLHVFARRKAAPKPTGKDAPQVPVPTEPQRPFEPEVLRILAEVYPAEALQTPNFANETKKPNEYRRLIFRSPNDNVVRVYLYKRDQYDVALIWDIPAAEDANATLATARDLTLQSFAVGNRANNYFSGSMSESERSEAASESGGAESAQPF